jgi:hypothetical protein
LKEKAFHGKIELDKVAQSLAQSFCSIVQDAAKDATEANRKPTADNER